MDNGWMVSEVSPHLNPIESLLNEKKHVVEKKPLKSETTKAVWTRKLLLPQEVVKQSFQVSFFFFFFDSSSFINLFFKIVIFETQFKSNERFLLAGC